MAADDDKILFIRIKSNDKPAFDILFKKYYARLCRFAFSYTKSKELAEESIQNIFVRLWCQRKNIEISDSVISYLFTAARNQAFNELKKNGIRRNCEAEFVSQSSSANVDQETLNKTAFQKHLENAIEQLPVRCREIFRLCKNEGLTYHEISDYLGISSKTVENQMGFAFKKLRELLGPVLSKLSE